jgi:4-amino-4-deoxy-L-arabinose transferase-like glycosyltransferase
MDQADTQAVGRIPGRTVWLPAALLAAVMASLILWQLLTPRSYFTGTNSVGVASVVATVAPTQRLCVSGLELPAGTGAVRIGLFAQRPTVSAAIELKTPSGVVRSHGVGTVGAASMAYVVLPIPTTEASPSSVPTSLCLHPLDGPVDVGGTAGLNAGQTPLVLSVPGARSKPVQVGNRVAVWFLPPGGHERSLLSQAGTIFSRAALFRPGVVGAWTYPVLLFGLMPALWLLSLLIFVRAAGGRELRFRGRRIRTGAAIVLIAFLNAGAWALITPAFQSPDEPDHFAYSQYLIENGHMPSKVPTTQPPFSTEQTLGLYGADTFSIVSNAQARPPWLALDEHHWERERQLLGLGKRGDGGGYTPGAARHPPPYYALTGAAYALVRSQSVYSQLTAMRLVSALLGAIVALCAFLLVRELFPRQRVAAVAAGLLVAFHPMFGFISGAVNNDSGINAAAALGLYLTVRALRRGLSWRLGLALGATLALVPLMKETGYEIYPAVAVGVFGILWRAARAAAADERRWRSFAIEPWIALAGGFVAVLGIWLIAGPHLQDTFPLPTGSGGGSSASASSQVSGALHMPGRFLSYLWQLFLPPLSFMGRLFPPGWPFYQVYIQRGWASFGWYTFDFPRWVYVTIVVAMVAVALLSLRAAWRHRAAVRQRGWEMAVVLLFPVCVLLAVEAAFFTPVGGRTVVAEQGRYIFPAIGALAAIAVGGTFGLGRRWHVTLASLLVVAMIALSFASQLLTLGSFYT